MRSSYKNPEQRKKQNLSIITVNIDSPLDDAQQPSPKEQFNARMDLLEDVLKSSPNSDLILLPAGFFQGGEYDVALITAFQDTISSILNTLAPETILCFGLDFDSGRDQLAIAVSSKEILAMGRKFYPTDSEKGFITTATSYLQNEQNHDRTFYIKDTKFYLAVCYDSFGIRHQKETNPQVDVILNLVHGFYPKGTGLSGDVDFARKGFTGASLQWNCPVFGAAVFFERKVPPKFPTAVLWTDKGQSVKTFKYEDNEIAPLDDFVVGESPEKAYCKIYKI